MSDRSFSFMVIFPFFRFFFTLHVDPIIEEVEFDIDVASGSLAVQVYNPPPSQAYVQLLLKELIRTREAIAKALKDLAHAKKKARRWSLIGEFIYNNDIGWKPLHSLTPLASLTISFDFKDSGDEFLKKLKLNII